MVQSFDEVEDLTRFADESFDTDTVDLFEFTGNDDSPLTRLKSIILSLDWEITDDILEELVEEVANLRTMWEGDKVAQVYLQGMDKIGKYLKVEGAYAHHNAIKLLFTLFYNYEKIISSADISGDTITSLLKSDIRKFKVLQYQIGMKDGSSIGSVEQAIDPDGLYGSTSSDNTPLTALEAAILGLDWEVTDEGLAQFNSQAKELSEHVSDNANAQVLLQGLQAIGAYISDEKINAHPDAFTLLHSFYDGLKTLVTDKDLDSKKRQTIIIERVSRLNSLKEIIAGTATPQPVHTSDDQVDHILEFEDQEHEEESSTEPVQFSANETAEEVGETAESVDFNDEPDINIDSDDRMADQPAGAVQVTADTVNAAMETADEKYPDEILDPAAIQPLTDEIADEFIEEELSISSQGEAALNDSDKAGLTFEPEDAPLSEEELDDELELLFEDEDKTGQKSTNDAPADDIELEELALGFDEEKTVKENSNSSTPHMAEPSEDVDHNDEDALNFGEELFLSEDDADQSPADDEQLVTPALADSDEEGGFAEEVESAGIGEKPSAELEDKLDSFFDISEEEPDIVPQPESAPTVSIESDVAEDTVVAALADESLEGGFREDEAVAKLNEDPTDALQDKLDSFFGSDEEPQSETAAEESSTPLDEELDSFFTEDEASATDQEVNDTMPALADADENSGFDEKDAVTGLADSAMGEIDDKLDSFFDMDTEGSDQKTATPIPDLSSLAAVAAALPASPSSTDLQQVAELVAVGKEKKHGTNNTVLLDLIDSAVTLLSKKHEAAAGSSGIVQELVSVLEDAENPNTLIEAVSRYTSWQQDFFDQMNSSQETSGAEAPSSATEITDDEAMAKIQSGFSQLRGTLKDEFESIRKELKKE